MVLIFSIPLEIMLSPKMISWESELIAWWQEISQFDNSTAGYQVFSVFHVSGYIEVAVLIQLAFFLGSDSLISYKTTMCYCIGVYMITMLQLLYIEPRPFWVNADINIPNGYCPISYAMPDQGTFNIIFFLSYTAFMQLYKYKRPDQRKSWQYRLAFFLIISFEIVYIAIHAFFGLNFMFQQFFSLLYTTIFLTVCINFDQEIMWLAETSGFISQTSRTYKFNIFFVSITLFVIASTLNSGLGDAWTNNLNYVENAINVSAIIFSDFSFIFFQFFDPTKFLYSNLRIKINPLLDMGF